MIFPQRTLLVIILFVFLLIGCYEKEVDTSNLPCPPGLSDVCYTGPKESLNVGVCHAGRWLCWEENGEIKQKCENEVVPTLEKCNGLDDDCDGKIDNNGACREEILNNLQSNIGELSRIASTRSLGPQFLMSRTYGTMYHCDALTIGEECILEFLSHFGGAYGIEANPKEASLSQQLEKYKIQTYLNLDGVAVRETHVYRQSFHGIPVIGGWFAITVEANKIISVQSSMLPVPFNLNVNPQIEINSIDEHIPEEIQELEILNKSLVILPMELGSNDTQNFPQYVFPHLEDIFMVLAYEIELGKAQTGVIKTLFINANTGELLGYFNKLETANGYGSGEEQGSGESIDTDALLDKFLHFIAIPTNPLNIDPNSFEFNVVFAQTESDCPQECLEGLGYGCANEQQMWICPNAQNINQITLERVLLHEASHYVFAKKLRYNQNNIVKQSISEALAMFHTELFLDVEENGTDWNHLGIEISHKPDCTDV